MVSHMLIGDVHVEPGVSNERLEWAGRFALDRRPETIICLGDFADMPSLSSYDKGRKDFEGRRFRKDTEASREALGLFNRPIDTYNLGQRRNRKAKYSPRKVMLGGNHDDRINRAIQLRPELDGTISVDDLGFKEHGWEFVPYGIPITIDGITYCHNFPSGVKGDPISGLSLAQLLLAKNMVSCTVGHIHLLDWAVRSTPAGRKIYGLSAGCFFEQHMKYAANTEHMWWRGLIMCNNIVDGEYDLETTSMREVKDKYG